jgi:hypothetical protein
MSWPATTAHDRRGDTHDHDGLHGGAGNGRVDVCDARPLDR